MLWMRNTVVAVLLLGSSIWGQESSSPGSHPASTDSSAVTDPTILLLMRQVRDLQKLTGELQEKLKALDAERAVSPTPAAATTPAPTSDLAVSTPQTPSSSTDSSLGEAANPLDLPRIHFRGFGEVNYQVLNQRQPELGTYGFVPGSSGSFYTGDFGLFLTARLTDKASVLAEMVFEEGDAQTYSVDLRRMLLKYDLNDHLKFSFGRYQTAIGYYNWAYRSAAWLQTTADRPLVMEFATNGGLLPTQAVGISVTGAIPSGKLDLNYVAEYGSSDTIRPDINGSGELTDENNGNHLNFAVFARPEALPGLQIGSSFYHDKISNIANSVPSSQRWGQTIVNAYVVYTAHRIEFLNEGFLIRDALLGGSVVFDMPAFYSQLSRRFGAVTPFLRYQYVKASGDNVIYDDVGLRYGPSFGVRYDLNDYIALKAQLDHTVRGGESSLNGLHLQMAFTF
jgi:hypothetical protein